MCQNALASDCLLHFSKTESKQISTVYYTQIFSNLEKPQTLTLQFSTTVQNPKPQQNSTCPWMFSCKFPETQIRDLPGFFGPSFLGQFQDVFLRGKMA